MKIIFISIFIVISSLGFSQNFDSMFWVDKKINSSDSNKVFLRLENNNFFKNNEYFGKLAKGYTLLGAFLQPKLVYYPSSNTKIQAGVHLLKYSGIDTLTQALPVISFQYSPAKGVDIVLGTIYGGANHKLIEPMYSEEYQFTDNVENGIQILINNKRLNADVWVNWEKFIFQGEAAQEIIVGGISSEFILTKPESKFKISVPFQTILAHHGGQIDVSNAHLQSLVNMTSGLNIDYSPNNKYIDNIGLNNNYISYNDISGTPMLPYITGYGLYFDSYIFTKYVNFKMGYYDGNYFIGPRGEPLFQSVSTFDNNYLLPRSQIITSKIAFHKFVTKDINVEARFESYYNIQQSQFEYSYGLHIAFNTNFFLTKIK